MKNERVTLPGSALPQDKTQSASVSIDNSGSAIVGRTQEAVEEFKQKGRDIDWFKNLGFSASQAWRRTSNK